MIKYINHNQNGNIYSGGSIRNPSNKICIKKTNGGNWSELGQGAYGAVNFSEINSIDFDQLGNVYASNSLISLTPYVSLPAKWNGTSWVNVGNASSANNYAFMRSIAYNRKTAKLFAVGSIKNDANEYFVANYNFSTNKWEETAGIGTRNISQPGSIVIGNNPDTVYVRGCDYIEVWDNISWNKKVLTQIPLSYDCISGLIVDKQNYFYASTTKGKVYKSKSNFLGTDWVEIIDIRDTIKIDNYKLTLDNNGTLYASGFYVNKPNWHFLAKWDGTKWNELGPGPNGLNNYTSISGVFVDKFNNIYLRAMDYLTNLTICKWNGLSWEKLPKPNNLPDELTGSLTTDTSGTLYGGFSFFGPNYIRKWTGTSWQLMQKCEYSFVFDKNNNLFQFGEGSNFPVNRWGGDAWYPLVTDTSDKFIFKRNFFADNRGNLYAFGTINDTLVAATINEKFLRNPFITRVSNKCQSASNASAKLFNPLSNSSLIQVFIDGVKVNYNAADSSFVYFTNGVTTLGNHKIIVHYNIGSEILIDSISFTVIKDFIPTITLTANPSILCRNQFTTLTATSTDQIPTSSYFWFFNGYNSSGATSSKTEQFGSNSIGTTSVAVKFISNKMCATVNEVMSNTVVINVVNALEPTASIVGATTITPGAKSKISFANIANLGSNPKFQWQDSTSSLGWLNIFGAIADTISYSPIFTGSKLRCSYSSSLSCASPITRISNILTFTVSNSSTQNNSNAAPSFNYFPNPVKNVLTIDSLKKKDNWETIEIRDTNGNVLLVQNISSQTSVRISVALLPKGIYLAVLRRKDGSIESFRFLKI